MAGMEQPDRIFLHDHVISAEIGAFQSERGRDQRLRFNLTVDLRDPAQGAADEVDAILSYDVLVQAVATAMASQRYDLVETLAEQIAAEVLTQPQAAAIEVTVEKLDRGPGTLGVSIRRTQGRAPAQGITPEWRLIVDLGGTLPAPEGAAVIVPNAPRLPLPDGGDQRRIALLALDQSAWSLAGRLGLEVAASRTELEAAIYSGFPVIWAPARLAGDAPQAGEAPLDLAQWLGPRLGAARVELALPDGAALPEPTGGLPVIRLGSAP